MSWSASGTATVEKIKDANDIYTYHEADLNIKPMPQTGYAEAESKTAIRAAKQAVRSLLESSAFGEGEFNVSLSGHANEGNVPSGPWTNDFVSISITQRSN